MKIIRHQISSKLVAPAALAAVLSLAAPQPALAYNQGAFAAGVIMVWVTYITGKTLICAPVAAFRASSDEHGFGGAFKNCWNWQPDTESSDQSDGAAADEQTRARQTGEPAGLSLNEAGEHEQESE